MSQKTQNIVNSGFWVQFLRYAGRTQQFVKYN